MKKIIALIFFASLIILLFTLPRIIKIKRVDCVTQYGSCDDKIKNALAEGLPQNLYTHGKKTKEFLKSETSVEEYSTQYKIPDLIIVNIKLEKPYYALVSETQDNIALIEKEGKVISTTSQSLLPKIFIKEALPPVGESISPKQLFSFELLANMFYLYKTTSGRLEEGQLVIDINEGPRVLFPQEGDIQRLIGGVRLIIYRLNEGGEDFRIEDVEEIDMRYKNPVIRT